MKDKVPPRNKPLKEAEKDKQELFRKLSPVPWWWERGRPETWTLSPPTIGDGEGSTEVSYEEPDQST